LEELLQLNFKGSSLRYLISDERSGHEIAAVLSRATGKKIPWVLFTDEQQKEGLLQAGLSPTHAENFTEMGKAMRTGKMNEHVKNNRPPMSATKLEDFAKTFTIAFNG
jgi:hypothetical protein